MKSGSKQPTTGSADLPAHRQAGDYRPEVSSRTPPDRSGSGPAGVDRGRREYENSSVALPWEWWFPSSTPPRPTALGRTVESRETDDDRLLDFNETASVIGVSSRSIRRWAATGRIPTVRVGARLVRIRLSVARRLIQEGLPPPDD